MGDSDGDGVPDPDEYLADTDPSNAMDFLQITLLQPTGGGATSTGAWTSKETRHTG